MLDPHGIVASWNAGAQRFKGYTEEEIIGEHFSRFYTDEDRADRAARRALETAASEGRSRQEGWRVRKDGTRFWAHVVIDPIRRRPGQPDRLCQDHPRHHRAEGRAGRAAPSEERFRLLVQGVTDYAIYMLDPTGGSPTGTRARSASRATRRTRSSASTSRASTPRRTASRACRRGAETAAREGRFEQEGWRVRKDGTPLLGACGHRCRSATSRAT